MVRRLKDDLRKIVSGFPDLRIAALLDQYRALNEERLAGESRRMQSASGLPIAGLEQRLFDITRLGLMVVLQAISRRRHDFVPRTPADTAIRSNSSMVSLPGNLRGSWTGCTPPGPRPDPLRS